MQKIGRDVSAAQYWADKNEQYVAALANSYHAHRLGVVKSLIGQFDPAGKTVLDFGCGDGVMLDHFAGATKIGIEPDKGLISHARARDASATFYLGGPAELAKVPDASIDLVLSLNVNAYMTDAEDRAFYEGVRRALKPGGVLVITHSNELFDLFTLNAYTVHFFETHFGTANARWLLVRPSEPADATYNIRENPLTYGRKLALFGLVEERQEFINYHEKPPLLGKDRAVYRDTLQVPEHDRWKLMFQCSTFGARARKA